MNRYLVTLNLKDRLARADENDVKFIHIAGTKGKGSTAAFCESLLRRAGKFKVGLYTSPHLRHVRERIKICGSSLSEAQFTDAFFHVWDLLQRHHGLDMPTYFQFLTLMAYHTFYNSSLDFAVIETGIGGLYDVTNIMEKPVASVITSLGFDHLHILGSTMQSITRHKAGIIKKGCPIWTVKHAYDECLPIIKQIAAENDAPLHVLNEHQFISSRVLGLDGTHQCENAALAFHVYRYLLPKFSKSVLGDIPDLPLKPSGPSTHCQKLSEQERQALMCVRWPGRCQILPVGEKLTFYLDGAHTVESIHKCVQWFQPLTCAESHRYLIFYCSSERNFEKLLDPLIRLAMSMPFVKIFFTNNKVLKNPIDVSSENYFYRIEPSIHERFEAMKEYWVKSSIGGSIVPIVLNKSLEEILDALASEHTTSGKQRQQVLCCGSLHLIGNMLELLDYPIN